MHSTIVLIKKDKLSLSISFIIPSFLNLVIIDLIVFVIYFFSSFSFKEPKSKIKFNKEYGNGFTV